MVEAGQTHVVGGTTGDGFRAAACRKPGQWMNANLRTTFTKIVHRAGLDTWPRLFHNMRASRETELLELFPVHVVALWMGHDAKVCLKHYAQTTDDHYARAVGGAKSGAPEAQNKAQQTTAGNRKELRKREDITVNRGILTNPCDSLRNDAHMFSGAGGI
ncbi:hypothetical protein [Limnoglobus roseus]|uniref:hypothetical protein n=1 Tax=Limnoglobus roseus TaxID=2598579 RepID=UPI0011EADBC4|nr:hypothetical protein [Limnoglobus roseus]